MSINNLVSNDLQNERRVKPLRVLHIPAGALPMINLCRALRSQGVQATACHFYANRYQFESDLCLNLQSIPKHLRESKIKTFFNQVINDYDIFHFHFGGTFFTDKSDLKLLKRAGKKMVVHHHGSDVRRLSIARRNNPFVRVKPEWTEELIKTSLTKLSAYIDHAIVLDDELKEYVKDYYQHIHVIPNIVDHQALQPHYPEAASNPLIIHAPTKRDLKGTEFVIDAVNQLKKAGLSFDFKLIEGMNHKETIKLLEKADIVIDQLRIGSAGYLSTEAMTLGKPVICYIRDDLIDKYPQELPIVNAHPNNLTAVLKNLILKPNMWKELGVKGRAYIKHHHTAGNVINQYLDVYKSL